MATDFAIKDGYTERPEPGYFVDASHLLHQPDVYEFAFALAQDCDAKGMVDVGCGRAGKLAALFPRQPDWWFVGTDYGPNIAWCREHYNWGHWIEADLERADAIDTGTWRHEFDAGETIVVCADVVEHLKDPRPMLAAIRESGCIAAVFSTPERDLTWGEMHNGPPPNPCHVREWNLDEFAAFLEGEGFRILHAGLTETDNVGTGEKTILVLAEPV